MIAQTKAILFACTLSISAQVPELAATYRQLQEFTEADLAQAVSLLTTYKQLLRTLTARTLATESDPSGVQPALEQALRQAGIRFTSPGEEPRPHPYGQMRNVEVHRPPGHPRLISVTYLFALSHAIDTSLTLYRGREPIFLADHNDYPKWELDAYEIDSPQFTANEPDGSFVMLLAASSGRSANGGYSLLISLFRFDSDFKHHSIFRQEYPTKDHQVALDPGGLRLESSTYSFDTLTGCCEAFPFRYSIRGESVTRTQPIGFNPHQFLQGWLNARWEDASQFTGLANRAKLQSFHAQQKPHGEYGKPERCDDVARLWQVSFDETVYFLIERTGTWHFRLLDLRNAPLESCKRDEEYPWPRTMFAAPLE